MCFLESFSVRFRCYINISLCEFVTADKIKVISHLLDKVYVHQPQSEKDAFSHSLPILPQHCCFSIYFTN